jgi:triacylglycerol lipase
LTSVAASVATRHPVVLVHGVLGFVRTMVGRVMPLTYFQGVTEALKDAGFAVTSVRLPACASVETRARALGEALDALGAERVNLVAHSMGGLDARWYVGRMGGERRVASLVTIGTPHRGTVAADWVVRRVGRALSAARVLQDLGIDTEGFADLTREASLERNALLESSPSVPTLSYAGARPWWATAAPLQFSFRIVQRSEGPNDGLVSTRSARWGEYRGTIEADHLAQTGWHWTMPGFPRFDHRAFYLDVARTLADRGF